MDSSIPPTASTASTSPMTPSCFGSGMRPIILAATMAASMLYMLHTNTSIINSTSAALTTTAASPCTLYNLRRVDVNVNVNGNGTVNGNVNGVSDTAIESSSLIKSTTNNNNMNDINMNVNMNNHAPSEVGSFVPNMDPIFAGLPIAARSFETVRKTYKISTEVNQPMAVVKLPPKFQGQYEPKNMAEFLQLAKTIFDDSPIGRSFLKQSSSKHSSSSNNNSNNHTADSTASSTAEYAIVSICVGMDLCSIAKRNHAHYARMHNYDYLLAATNVDGIHPKMLKYLLLAWAINQPERNYKWIMMMDADALFTNSNIALPGLIQTFQPYNHTSLIATRGGNWKYVHGINNGIFLLKNNQWSLQHCFEVYTAQYAYTRFLGRTLMDQPIQLSILIAQNQLQWPPQKELERNPNSRVIIVDKRSFNSFRREESYSKSDASEGGQWEQGDFIAHFASGKKYSLMVDLLEEQGITNEVPPVEDRFPFPLPAKGRSSKTGHCWCNHQTSSDGVTTTTSAVSCLPSYHVIGVHKAGTKSILRYLQQHPGMASTGFIEDPTRWLTDKTMKVEEQRCEAMSKKHESSQHEASQHEAAFLRRSPGSRAISTCSFEDYALLNGQAASASASSAVCSSNTINNDEGESEADAALMAIPVHVEAEKPLFDEMVIWDHTFSKIRGVGLPELFHRMQPNANLLVTVRNSVDVTYSAYNHFGVFSNDAAPAIVKGPAHFDSYIRDVTKAWLDNKCTVENHKYCLPPNLAQAGSWLSRAMYSKHLKAWLSHFQCPQLHLFDVAEDPRTEVERLYEFIGMPNEEVAMNVTQSTYLLQANATAAVDFGGRRDKNPMNKAKYDVMLDSSRSHLDDFFSTYNDELCALMEEHPCLNVPTFAKNCKSQPTGFEVLTEVL